MAKYDYKIPDQATPEFLIDEMAKMSMCENYAKKARNILKEAYYARTGIKLDDFINGEEVSKAGEMFIATTVRSDPVRVDTTKLKEEYPDIASKVSTSKGQLATRFSLREGVVNPKVESLIDQIKAELDLD
jgi:hypothetical protein